MKSEDNPKPLVIVPRYRQVEIGDHIDRVIPLELKSIFSFIRLKKYKYEVVQVQYINKKARSIDKNELILLDIVGKYYEYVSYHSLFEGCTNLEYIDFPEDVDTSCVIDMSRMFYNCSNIESIRFSEKFNTSNVVNMSEMFYGCNKLKGLNVSMFVTSKVVNMIGMFNQCYLIDSLDCSSFDTSNVISMKQMFKECYKVRNFSLLSFDTSKVTDMESMFYGCTSVRNLNISSFDTSRVKNMKYMFYYCASLRVLKARICTSSAKDLSYMFSNCRRIESLEFGKMFDTSNVQDMSYIFYGCIKLKKFDFGISFNTKNVEYMNGMFKDCLSIVDLDLLPYVTKKVVNMNEMFMNCKSLENLKLHESFETVNVTDMSHMFSGCTNIKVLNLLSFNLANAINLSYMFNGCQSLSSIEFNEHFNFVRATCISFMFLGCKELESLDFSSADFSCLREAVCSFYGCDKLHTIYYNQKAVYDSKELIAGISMRTSLLDGRSRDTKRKMLTEIKEHLTIREVYYEDIYTLELYVTDKIRDKLERLCLVLESLKPFYDRMFFLRLLKKGDDFFPSQGDDGMYMLSFDRCEDIIFDEEKVEGKLSCSSFDVNHINKEYSCDYHDSDISPAFRDSSSDPFSDDSDEHDDPSSHTPKRSLYEQPNYYNLNSGGTSLSVCSIPTNEMTSSPYSGSGRTIESSKSRQVSHFSAGKNSMTEKSSEIRFALEKLLDYHPDLREPDHSFHSSYNRFDIY